MTSPDEGPEWANEAHLDEVFSTWVPGPPDSASTAEKEMAGENPRLQLPAEDEISDEDMDAALAAALAEAEESTGADFADESVDVDPSPSVERSEPRSPSWLNVSEPETPPAPPEPSSTEPDGVFDADPEPFFEPEVDPDQSVDLEPFSREEPATAPFSEAELEPEPPAAPFDPGPPPPPEGSGVARPWTRSDDDILPGRKGKGRRR